MDPITSVIVAGAFGHQAAKFLERAVGPIADEVGDWGREKVRAFRNRNVQAVATRAAEMLDAVNAEPSEVPLKILLPLLEAASRETEQELIELWSALLANSSLDELEQAVLPVFPQILGQLTPLDAALLKFLNSSWLECSEPVRSNHPAPWGPEPHDISAELGIAEGERLDISIDTLTALGLARPEPGVVFNDNAVPFLSNGRGVRITQLGRRFVAACSAPREKPARGEDSSATQAN